MKKTGSLLLILVVLLSMTSCGIVQITLPTKEPVQTEPVQTEPVQTEPVQTEPPSTAPATTQSNKVKIPDLSDVDEASAKQSLTNKGLLPVVSYEYSDLIKKGNVIRTHPSGGTSVEPDTKVTIYVSNGPKSITSRESTIEWYNVDSSKPDEWAFYSPTIEDGYLYVHCETTFGTSFTLKRNGFGNASLTDSFDKYAPLTLLDKNGEAFSEGTKVSAGEMFDFFIRISLAQLDSERPTHVACLLVILNDGIEENIRISFNISW